MKTLSKFRLVLLSIAVALSFVLLMSEKSTPEFKAPAVKINGVSLVASARPIQKEDLVPVTKLNAGWVAITPYAFSESGKPEVIYNRDRQWWGEKKEGVAQTISYAKALGLHVMLKPHVWLHGAGWTGNFSLQNESQWKQWEHDYGAYITEFAHLADSLHVEMICIGTEYDATARQRPEFWRKLIKNIRQFYDGKLTYAANWDSYQTIPFWDALDYIGVDAYFPLSGERTPSVEALKESWQPIKKNLKQFSRSAGKPILFTEYGYESVEYTAAGHWNFDRGERSVNLQAQADAYLAVFKSFWNEPWFAGGFLWKWRTGNTGFHREANTGYTPQNKPAEKIICQQYSQQK